MIICALVGLIALFYRVYIIERSKSKRETPSTSDVLAPFNKIFGPEVFLPVNPIKYPKITNVLLIIFYLAFLAVIIIAAIGDTLISAQIP